MIRHSEPHPWKRVAGVRRNVTGKFRYTYATGDERLMATAAQQKGLGAYYTSEIVAKFLVEWAVRGDEDIVLDPSCGSGVFLCAAAERLRNLGSKKPEVWGIDIDPTALKAARYGVPRAKLLEQDFFKLMPSQVPSFSTIVGNPPFIRYQSFNGSKRLDALDRALEAGVELPQLSSSWAPFLVHAAGFLREGGRLGMVAPAELSHAQYAREVLRFLIRKFHRITIRLFQHKLFPELSEATLLLLCEGFGSPCSWFCVAPAKSIEEVRQPEESAIPVDIEAIRSGRGRLTRYLLPPKAQHLYEQMSEHKSVTRLGEAADVGIGYVTGCNDYFHVSSAEAAKWQLSKRFLRKALLSLGNYRGLAFRDVDWSRVKDSGGKAYLLALPATGVGGIPRAVRKYIERGEQLGVSGHFKCRVRDPWYSVPHIRIADAFLSYMSGEGPKLVANTAKVVAPNTLHVVRFLPPWRPQAFVVGWYSSLTRLSCELEGHPLGGGMLKLEPTEAEQVMVALPQKGELSDLSLELDRRLRDGDAWAAMDFVDTKVLRKRFGLSGAECLTLRDAAEQLESWRMHR